MKRLLVIFLTITLMIQFIYPSKGEDEKPTLRDAQDKANEFYLSNPTLSSAFLGNIPFPDRNFSGYTLDAAVYEKYNLLGYNDGGDIDKIEGQQKHPTSGEPKYLGYSAQGNYIYNPDYDVTTTVTQNFDQVKKWDDPLIAKTVYNSPHLKNIDVDNNINTQAIKDYVLPQFIKGMDTIEDAIKSKLSPNWKNVPWEDYYTILSLPTRTTDGRVILTHTDGQYFMTVRLASYSETEAESIILPETPPEALPIVAMTGDAIIGHNELGKEIYSTLSGVPTSENLYVSVVTPEFIATVFINQISGTYTYTTDEDDGVDEDGVPKTKTVYHDILYTYYEISDYEVFSLDYAETTNYALPAGKVKLNPKNYTVPSVTYQNTANRSFDSTTNTLTVTNDALTIDGQIILAGSSASGSSTVSTDTANSINIPGTDRTVLYETGLKVPDKLLNKTENSSTTTVYYKYLASKSGTILPSKTISPATNHVTIHTPVVCDGAIKSINNLNQEITPDATRAALILGESTQIQFPTAGQHLNIAGYGQKDYQKYMKSKEISFPFDVYIHVVGSQTKNYLPANTWYSVPLGQTTVDLTIPIWVTEGNYTVQYRTTAINAPTGALQQTAANINAANYIATDSSAVRVIGRLYGFKITDIEDYPLWEEVFRASIGSNTPSGKAYTPGLMNQNGQTNGNTQAYTLPIMPGSHPTIKNEGAIKKGYTFKYQLETIGNYFGNKDCISITPSFYYVSEDGKTRQEVDLYYTESFENKTNYFVKVGSELDKNNDKYISLKDPDRNVSTTEIKNTSLILGITETAFKALEAKLGWFHWVVLAKPLRTFVGQGGTLPSVVDPSVVMKSKQRWYGEYYLPDLTYVAPKDYNVLDYGKTHNGLDGEEDFWLKEGYIVVHFEIETIQSADFEHPILSYGSAPGANMWEIEGYQNTKMDNEHNAFTLNDGDIVFYYTDQKSSDDYNERGTH